MVSKYSFVLCALASIGFAAAGVVPIAPAAPVLAKLEDFDAAPQYSFAYDVQDSLTGDSKAQYETRNGDVVQGSYSLIEADGTRRIVDYTADPVNGFNAVVNREPAVAVAKTVVPAPAAPLVAKAVVAPAAVSAPIVAPAAVAAPIVAPARIAAPIVAPARIAAPLIARNYVQPAAIAAAYPYTIPRAVATRLAPPAAFAAYAVAPNYI